MKDLIITNKILNWYDINKRSLPWRNKVSQEKKQYFTLVSEFMLQQTQVATVIPYFNRFIKNIPNIEKLSKYNDRKLTKLWEGLGYYSRVRNLKKTAQIIVKKFNKKIPRDFYELKSLPGIGDYTASAISAIAFNKPIIPLDGNIERVLKRYLYLKKQSQIKKEFLQDQKKIFGTSTKRSSDYAQALMELGALICKPTNPTCNKCPLSNNCKAFKNKNFDLVKFKKINKETYYKLNVYKKNNQYLLIKNNKFNFLKNLNIFPMDQLNNPKNFDKDLNFKISNMNMNIKIEYKNKHNFDKNINWINPAKLENYVLPTFTKKDNKIFRKSKMKKIAIIGAGISGLFVANLFKGNKDYQVTIYEKKTSLEIEEGYGIQLSVNSVKLLNKLGFSSLSDKEKFNPKKIDFYQIKNSKKICDLDISEFNSDDCKYTTLKRSKLLQFLINGLDKDTIQFNCSLDKIEYSNDSINLTFDKEKITCDHLIISDGVFSKGKSLISNNNSEPIYNNTIAVRASISKESLDNINEENISLFLGSDFHYVLYPLNNDKNFNFIGILKNKLNSDQQKNHNLCNESTFIESIKQKLSEKISSKVFQSLEDIKLFPVFVSKNPFIPPKNIYLVGDAFFAFSPSFAQGASQSIEGANQLHEIIINQKNDFYNSRLERVKMINRRSDFNQFAFHLSNPIMIFFRNIFLKLLTKNKKFLQSYLGKIYKD